MSSASYVETFDRGPGGWVRVVDNVMPPAALPVRDGALWSFGPWWWTTTMRLPAPAICSC